MLLLRVSSIDLAEISAGRDCTDGSTMYGDGLKHASSSNYSFHMY